MKSVYVLGAFALFVGITGVNAANVGSITINEAGVGSFTSALGGAPISLTVSSGGDTGPGAIAGALVYTLPAVATPTPGDVILLEPGSSSISDVLRFEGNKLYFYSDNTDGVGALADVGIPAVFQTNNVTMTEVEGSTGFNYTPTSGQPGFDTSFQITFYHAVSDAPAPEPASLALLAVGGLALLSRRRTR